MNFLDKLPKPEKNDCIIDFAGIREILPHRYPFLFIDKVISFDAETKTVVAQKNVSFNEPYFQGHFPEEPVMPGVIQIEAMAQAGVIMEFMIRADEIEGKRPAFMGVDSCRFRRPVRPGDVLIIEVKELKYRRGIISMETKITVGDDIVANAILMATMT